MSRCLPASFPRWIAASRFLPSLRTLAGDARRPPDGANSSFRSGKPALSSCSKSGMIRYSSLRHEHSGKRTTARLDGLSGAGASHKSTRTRRRSKFLMWAVGDDWLAGVGHKEPDTTVSCREGYLRSSPHAAAPFGKNSRAGGVEFTRHQSLNRSPSGGRASRCEPAVHPALTAQPRRGPTRGVAKHPLGG